MPPLNPASPLLGGGSSVNEGVPAPQAPQGPSAPNAPADVTAKLLGEAQGRYDAVKKVYTQLERVRKGLDALTEKGDSVTEDDVLDKMADLVAHGADPKNLAAIMAGNTEAGIGPMPPGGEPLAGWLRNTEEVLIAPLEAQLKPALALAQHQLGVAAMHRLVETHAAGAGGAAQPPQAQSPALAPSAAPTPDLAAASPATPLLH